MCRFACGRAALLIAVFAFPQRVPAQQPEPTLAAGTSSLLAMPFVPQSQVLCGGAALAMVLRHHGIRGVQAEDFAHLVVDTGEGILTGDLTAAARAHGLDATPFAGTGSVVRALLAAGRPVIALIENRRDIYHYVVLLAWGDGRVLFHDPAVGPHQVMTEAELLRAWAPTGYWALRTQRADAEAPSMPLSAPPGPDVSVTDAPAGDVCAERLNDAAAAAAADDLSGAEQLLDEAAIVCADVTLVARERAGLRFRQQRYGEAEADALLRTADVPDDVHAWELVAASRFLRGAADGALAAWNRIGRPHSDLTRISGLRRTPYRVVSAAVGIAPGAFVASERLAHAGRRVEAVPAVARARVGYQPVGTDTVQIDVAVVEHGVSPFSPVDMGENVVRAAVDRSLLFRSANALRLGERWRLEAVWQENRRAFHVGVSVPGVFAMRPVAHLDAGVRDWAFADPDLTDQAPLRESRRTAAFALSDWAGPHVRWRARVGAEDWTGSSGTIASAGLGGALHLHDERVVIAVDVAGWSGGDRDVVGRVRMNAELAMRRGATEAVLLLYGALTSQAAPRALWSGAGTGRTGAAFLRAHPLRDRDGVIRSHWWAPRLGAATFELRRWLAALGPVELGAAVFVDGAVAGAYPLDVATQRSHTAVDGGLGLRVRVAGGPMLRLDAAHGIGNGASALSVGIGMRPF